MLLYLRNSTRSASRIFQIPLSVARERLQCVSPAPECGSNNVTISYRTLSAPMHSIPPSQLPPSRFTVSRDARNSRGIPSCSSDCRVLQLKFCGVVMVTSAVLTD